ncbi:nitroreductase [Sphingomonas sp.]|uniref:nitroreductase family protein n=1 Tax=Sphingomonas sp. TaxID=28214 RepID=UPI00286B024F|nr:nitroreductase [Sphingomonas sp.]
MLNDRSSPLSLLESRRSAKPRDLVGPAPTPEDIARIFAIAARVPDHGKLSPWRFIAIADDQREALAALLHRALDEEDRDATAAHREKAEQFAHNQGALIVLVSAPVENHKIPVWEQILSCGAAGMNLLLGAHALGFVAGWVTGWQAYSESVSAAFCGPGERIAGFIFIGHPGLEMVDRPRPSLAEVSRPWPPPQALLKP